jgi:penicillin-binding protein-related factor A (putative recombinase)
VISRARHFGGKVAQRNGNEFEQLIQNHSSQKVEVFRIENGCKNITQGRMCKLIRVKQPFDFILTGFGKTICLDAKSTEGSTFPYSSIDEDQLHELNRISKNIFRAGYLVFFRTANKIIFLTCEKLSQLKPRESLDIEDGLDIGTRWNLNLSKLFD